MIGVLIGTRYQLNILPHLPHSFLSEYPAQKTLLLPHFGHVAPGILCLRLEGVALLTISQITTPTAISPNIIHTIAININHSTLLQLLTYDNYEILRCTQNDSRVNTRSDSCMLTTGHSERLMVNSSIKGRQN
jgi:hypothetical protein